MQPISSGFLDRGADLLARDHKGYTALDHANRNESEHSDSIIELLVAKGCTSKFGRSANSSWR